MKEFSNHVQPNEISEESKKKFLKKKLLHGYSKIHELKLVTIGLASPEKIQSWAEKELPNGKIFGEVTNANTFHYKTFKPSKGGLFCERIFGPMKDFECACGKRHRPTALESKKILEHTATTRYFCPTCDVEYTWSIIRRYQLGYIQLNAPVAHLWYFQTNPSYLSILFDFQKRNIQSIIYCNDTMTIENVWKLTEKNSLFSQSPGELYATWQKVLNFEQKIEYSESLFQKQKRKQKKKKTLYLSTSKINNVFSTLDFENSEQELQRKQKQKFFSKQNLFERIRQQKSKCFIETAFTNPVKQQTINIYKRIEFFFFYDDLVKAEGSKKLSQLFHIFLLYKELFFQNLQRSNNTKKELEYFFFFHFSLSHWSFKYGQEKTHSRRPRKNVFLGSHALHRQTKKPRFENISRKDFVFFLSIIPFFKKLHSFEKQNFSSSQEKKLQSQFFKSDFQILKFERNKSTSFTKRRIGNIFRSLILLNNSSNEHFQTAQNGRNIQNIIESQGINFRHIQFCQNFYAFIKLYWKIQISFFFSDVSEKTKSQTFSFQKFSKRPTQSIEKLSIFEKILFHYFFVLFYFTDSKFSKKTSQNQQSFQFLSFNREDVFFAPLFISFTTRVFSNTQSYETHSKHGRQILQSASVWPLLSLRQREEFAFADEKNRSFIPDNFSQNGGKQKIEIFNTLSTSRKTFQKKKGKKLFERNFQLKNIAKRNSQQRQKKYQFLKNPLLTLSYKYMWKNDSDWKYFLYYNSFFFYEFEDIPIFHYQTYFPRFSTQNISNFSKIFSEKSKNKTFSISNSLFSASFSRLHSSVQKTSTKNGINRLRSSIGAGVLEKLLQEYTTFELKKMTKQHQILLPKLHQKIAILKENKKNTNPVLVEYYPFDSPSKTLSGRKSSRNTETRRRGELQKYFQKKEYIIRRLKFLRKFEKTNSNPNFMLLQTLPVLPPDLRPILKLQNQVAASDLNRFYQRIIYRNDRFQKFFKDFATNQSFEIQYAQRLLQEAVDNLIQNGKGLGKPETNSRGQPLKSLSEILKGKQGRFRQYLLGKRVDYSGRSVIVVGPQLKLYECGLPKEMALELFLPFLIQQILQYKLAQTVIGAKNLLKNDSNLTYQLLNKVMKKIPVLLNRAPTLHRLGFQAFFPKLVDGRAILLHPMVCPGFNADFDGDQMAVHIPLTVEARTEAWKFMLSINNLRNSATGDPIILPSQDMVLGCYYLTNDFSSKFGAIQIQNTLRKFETKDTTRFFLENKSFLIYQNFESILTAYQKKEIFLHTPVWIKWNFQVDFGNTTTKPLEIRFSKRKTLETIYSNSNICSNEKHEKVRRYIRTTVGRVLLNFLLFQRIFDHQEDSQYSFQKIRN